MSDYISQDSTTLQGATQEVIKGDTSTLTFTLGTSFPLSGKIIHFMAKSKKSDLDAVAVLDSTCVIVDAVNGICSIDISASGIAVGKYYAEVEIRDSSDINPKTALQFILSIVDEIRIGT